MKKFQVVMAIVALWILPGHLFAQTNASNTDGKIVEQAVFALPSYEQLPVFFQTIYAKDLVDGIRNSSDLELIKIKYLSDGLKISGFIYKPKNTAGKKFPVVIWNHGMVDESSKIGVENFNDIYDMYRIASEGFVVLASQYRGIDGSEGKDEIAGADTDDVMNLFPLARTLGYVDMDRIFMWGLSRGALMTLQAIKLGAPVKAAVVVGTPTDYLQRLKDPGFVDFVKGVWPDFETRKEEHARNRSAVLWADRITVPLLILHGGADTGVQPRDAMAFAQKMGEAGNLYELVIYARDDHAVNRNAEDRLRRTIDWFKNVRKMSIAQPVGKTIREAGIEAAIKQYRELKQSQSRAHDFAEPELNTLGYQLLSEQKVKEAIEIFKLNVEAYPQGFNAYDSLGEAYMINGDRPQAITNYKKSLELNGKNTNAVEMLQRLAAP